MTGTLFQIKPKINSSEKFKQLKTILNESSDNLSLKGVNGSLTSFIVDHIYNYSGKKIFIISHDIDRVVKLKDDIDLIGNSIEPAVYSSKLSDSESTSGILINLAEGNDFVVISNATELGEKIISRDKFKASLFEIKKEENKSFDELIETLDKYNFNRKDFVEEQGDYSVRGGIVDLFSENMESPVRIEFFGDTIESVREFDINSQRSVREIVSVKIGINLNADSDESDDDVKHYEPDELITDYLPEDTLVIIDEPEITINEIKDKDLITALEKFRHVYISSFANTISEHIPSENSFSEISFESKSQPDFHSNLRSLYNNLCENISKGYEAYILTSDEHQAKRIRELLEDLEDDEIAEQDDRFHHEDENDDIDTDNTNDYSGFSIKNKFIVIPESVHSGFLFNDCKILLYTEHQIFGRYFKQFKKKKLKFKGLSFSELKELEYGDFVVHRDFGVGKYSGLKKITVGNSHQEVVVLSYHGSDTLFLNMNSINLIKKYSGAEGHTPALTRLGGGEWDKLKAKTKKQVKDIARDLILLYAKRKSEKGFRFSADTHWQKELEANFMYEDTPDQFRATEETKEDMETENPMDRLVCGDVGFGKTEVAVRAAFKAVMDNKQVAVLVPTTILAVQHYNTFRDRLSPFAVEVDNITRLRNRKEQKNTLERLKEGKLNILIGTHRILSKDIDFRDLGLLIIDEEQRFGVKAKEKLRSIKPNVDTLTLTATPIPRTLNFSLLGARDLSIINTPPKNRKPIATEIIKLDWDNIAGIIRHELNRGGQVYFVNDKVKNLYRLGDTIKNYVPEAKIGIAHGQMDGKELEDVVINFIEKKLNVLLCTKIIESGLDIPNVNTIIINNANMYGLAELYQLRGRVGRSEVQAFAYLISPPDAKLTKIAVKRLQAIEEFTDLGSGFLLAMRDMEIRGVGNLLGKQQSGFIQEIGFDLFISTIEEAVLELKENEFKDLFRNETSLQKINESIKKKIEERSTIIENDLNALIPKDYIHNDTERLNIYRRLYELKTEEDLIIMTTELKDRFGEYLDDVSNLLRMIGIKLNASKLGFEKLTIRNRYLTLYFPEDKENKLYHGEFFDNIIQKISYDRSGKYELLPEKDRLVIEIELAGIEDEERLSETEELLKGLVD
ncbi:MAG TPA: transcription-repair coupling factor [Ignavibacteria bacterium]|nr:transcription-repair coupling factor [Ignavibacteria bacterium]HMR41927.1 transcription-repair coupling factor [Ignavibacteria bacterium]